MTRLPSRSIIFSKTIDTGFKEHSTLFQAFTQAKDSLIHQDQACNREKVLRRHIQKSRSELKSVDKYDQQMNSVRKVSDLHRYMIKLSSIQEERERLLLRKRNIKRKNRQKMSHREAKSQMYETKRSIYLSTERQRMQNERRILIESQKQKAKKQIMTMRQRIKEKKRAYNILDYFNDKVDSIKKEKQKDVDKLLLKNAREKERLDKQIFKNQRLRVLREKSLKSMLKNAYQEEKRKTTNNPERQNQQTKE